MKYIIVLLFSMVVAYGYGQSKPTPEVKQFLNEFVNTYEKVGNLYYRPTVNLENINLIVRVFNYQESDSMFRNVADKKTTFVFSPEEKELIKKTWLEQKYKAWDSALLERAPLFREKALTGEDYTREEWLEYKKQFEGKNIIQFSTPVFLRNDSLCVFFYANGNGGTIHVMQKENGKWVKYLNRVVYYI